MTQHEPQPDTHAPVCDDPLHAPECDCGAHPDRAFERRREAGR